MPDVIFQNIVDHISVTNTYFTLDLPQNMDSLVPGSPIIIVHNDDSDWFGDTGRKNTFLFLNRGWLDAVKTEAAADPFQPWDTRLSIYNMRLEIFKKRWTIAKWRPWRNAQVPIPPGPQGSSDIAMTWSSVDSQLLNAVCVITAYLCLEPYFTHKN